jgi:hypothetical protein
LKVYKEIKTKWFVQQKFFSLFELPYFNHLKLVFFVKFLHFFNSMQKNFCEKSCANLPDFSNRFQNIPKY